MENIVISWTVYNKWCIADEFGEIYECNGKRATGFITLAAMLHTVRGNCLRLPAWEDGIYIGIEPDFELN